MSIKDAVGYEGIYVVSDDGRVFSKDREIINPRYGKGFKKGREMSYQDIRGYARVFIRKRNEKSKSVPVHRLVAMAFIPNPKNLPQVNHIDGNKKNNSVKNLEWVTASQNKLHSFRVLGAKRGRLGCIGSLNSNSRAVYQYDLNGNFIQEWGSILQAQKKIGVNNSAIGNAARGKYSQAGGFKWKYKSDVEGGSKNGIGHK